jgi:hypothetical protein
MEYESHLIYVKRPMEQNTTQLSYDNPAVKYLHPFIMIPRQRPQNIDTITIGLFSKESLFLIKRLVLNSINVNILFRYFILGYKTMVL